jgi:hypothetical protein
MSERELSVVCCCLSFSLVVSLSMPLHCPVERSCDSRGHRLVSSLIASLHTGWPCLFPLCSVGSRMVWVLDRWWHAM